MVDRLISFLCSSGWTDEVQTALEVKKSYFNGFSTRVEAQLEEFIVHSFLGFAKFDKLILKQILW